MTNINMDRRTTAWINKNGGVVTLNPFYPLNQNKQRGPVDVMLSFDVPENEGEFEAVFHNGITIYVHRHLRIKRQLSLRISGFGPFQHLSCSGIKHFGKKSAV
ncbi:hypothetical protein [Salibacterium aidingense]|uniref:hypothetical protein n=1 Tax=Salibacterium aidingense TaxID=384933 RepID=UPI00040A1834|nr:hypothetical protein [Salibacterium aidingense]